MSIQSNRPLSNSRRAVAQLREMIFSGELSAGSDHLESEVADKLSMSRTPVREAVLTLEGQGLVELRPRKGMRVLPVSLEDMAEVYSILTEIESLAAEQAAAIGHSVERLSTMVRSVEDMEAAIAAEDREAWAEADYRFHAELAALSGNSRIVHIAGTMSDQVRRAHMTTLFVRPLPVRSTQAHRALLEAICAGDPARARAVHNAHRTESKRTMIELLKTHRLRHL